MMVVSTPRNQQAAAFPESMAARQRLPAADLPATGLTRQAGWCVTNCAKGCQLGFSTEQKCPVL